MEHRYSWGSALVKLVSFEEGLAVLAALATVAVSVMLLSATVLTSSVLGALAAGIVAYLTFCEFTLAKDIVVCRNRFRKVEFPLSHIKVRMRAFWRGLPGKTFMFVMRSPPALANGYFFRIGLVSWPSATPWIEAVNSAIPDKGKNQASG
jgi:hypothetical protein